MITDLTALKRDFEASVVSICACTANSMVACAVLTWIDDLQESDVRILQAIMTTLKKNSWQIHHKISSTENCAKSLNLNVVKIIGITKWRRF